LYGRPLWTALLNKTDVFQNDENAMLVQRLEIGKPMENNDTGVEKEQNCIEKPQPKNEGLRPKFQVYVRKKPESFSEDRRNPKRCGFLDLFRTCYKAISGNHNEKQSQPSSSLAPLKCNCGVEYSSKRRLLNIPNFQPMTKRK